MLLEKRSHRLDLAVLCFGKAWLDLMFVWPELDFIVVFCWSGKGA